MSSSARLVQYGSSDEEDGDSSGSGSGDARSKDTVTSVGPARASSASTAAFARPSAKRRKLSGFVSSTPSPSPSLSTPLAATASSSETKTLAQASAQKTLKPGQIEGDWLCHAFVRVPLCEDVRTCLQSIVKDLVDACNTTEGGGGGEIIQLTVEGIDADAPVQARGTCDGSDNASAAPERRALSDFHISLTRPILVRPHEREEFRRIIRDTLGDHSRFNIHFAKLITLVNDDRSRLFFALEAGMGWEGLHTLTTALNKPLSSAFRAKAYYTEARYHASFASVALPARSDGSADAIARRWERIAGDIDKAHARTLSRCPPFAADCVGIRVGSHVTELFLQPGQSQTVTR
ncbi:poly(U)-specific 3'-to-5' RNA exonuclease [Tilletia horrida]|nr:poly(U)-specific 3'-to-5' RNA exonuclease [Tilletia horrida]